MPVIHFLQFFFAPPSEPWFTGAVWGNVVAIVPCGIVAWFYARTKRLALHARLDALEARHAEHAEKLDELLARVVGSGEFVPGDQT